MIAAAFQFLNYPKALAGAYRGFPAPGGEIDLKAHETKTVTLVPRAGT